MISVLLEPFLRPDDSPCSLLRKKEDVHELAGLASQLDTETNPVADALVTCCVVLIHKHECLAEMAAAYKQRSTPSNSFTEELKNELKNRKWG
jgi:hypothetical protein